jgi:glycosyltransferase involved in cell wall biosynthesis
MHKIISVIVVTYNRKQHLRWCLEALGCQTLQHNLFEVIVVDDGGYDNSVEEITQALERYPDLQLGYVHHPHDGWGLAKSRNEGARLSTGRCLVFIDADILLNPNALKAYARILHRNPHRVIGGYYKYLLGMRITLTAIREWKPIWEMTLPEIDIPQHNYQLLGTDVRQAHFEGGLTPVNLFADEDKLYPNPYSLLGGNIMVPRHIWNQTEGFDEFIAHYGGEDAEFSLQIADLGYQFSYSMSAGGCHMAHPKQHGAEAGTMRAEDYMRVRWPTWFTEFDEPIWAFSGWKRPKRGGRTPDASMVSTR